MIAANLTNIFICFPQHNANAPLKFQLAVFFHLQCDTWHSWFTRLSSKEAESNMFSQDGIGCAWLPLGVPPEKCSLISSALAAMQGQGSIDNQSFLQLVNCPGC